eukprot:gene4385-7760_t
MSLNEVEDEVLCYSFNQNKTHFSVGTQKGFQIYSCKPFKMETETTIGGIRFVEMLFRSNILALVGGGKNPAFEENQVILWDDKYKKSLGSIKCKSEIKNIKLQRNLLIIVTETEVKTYDHDLTLIETYQTIENPEGRISFSPDPENIVLGFPATQRGTVKIQLISQQKNKIFNAHDTNLAYLASSKDGKKICTASEKGTLLRIFDIESGDKIKELRRGTSTAKITSIDFSHDGKYLSCASDSGTIHLFALESNENITSSFSIIGGFMSYVNSEWSFAHFKDFEQEEGNFLCSFSGNDHLTIRVLTSIGNYYILKYDQYKKEFHSTKYSFLKKLVKD